MSFGKIVFEVDGDGIALLTINRPEKLNALNAVVISELREAFAKVREDASVKGLILTGAGEKAFVAGADIKELSVLSGLQSEALATRGQATFRILETMRKPSVAAINGYALGGGMELAMSASIRIAATGAKMGQPEVKLGIAPGYGATQRLPRLVGRGRALELLLSGDTIDAAEAYRIGLVNQVVPPEELLNASKTWLKKVLANGPLAVALTMHAVDTGLDLGLDAGLRVEAMAIALAASSEDRVEGTRAFLEKRKPVFAGR